MNNPSAWRGKRAPERLWFGRSFGWWAFELATLLVLAVFVLAMIRVGEVAGAFR